ncbi:MAG: winged helix-turn-helix transcriptional regulator, partial [Eisenbergiella sp.]
MKKNQDELQKDMLETACRLLSGDGLIVVSALYRKSMTLLQLCRWTKDCPEERMCQTLGQLEKSGIICRDAEEEGTGEFGENVRWRLTELGGELEEVFTGLERFGRLYERLLQLGIDVREEKEGRWGAAESPE